MSLFLFNMLAVGGSLFGLAKRPVVAVVLAGGGAIGLAHIGVLEGLEDLGIPIDIVVGTSMGAMVGGAYAIGYSPQDMEQFVAQVNWSLMFSESTPMANLSLRDRDDRSRFLFELPFNLKGIKLKNGFFLGQNVTALMDRMTLKTPRDTDFDQFPRRFRAVATDIASGQPTVLSKGSLSDAIRASMNLPALFAPYIVDGHFYVDGGVTDNLPIDVAKSLGADIIIAVNFNMHVVTDLAELSNTPWASVQRSMDIMIFANVQQQLKDADIVITPVVSDLSTSGFEDWKRLIQRGREAVTAAAPQLEKILKRTGTTDQNSQAKGTYFSQQPDPIVSEIKVDGGTQWEQEGAKQLFAPLVGKPVTGQDLIAPTDGLYQSGAFDFVKIRNEPIDPEHSILHVELIPRSEGEHSLSVGVSYQGTYADSTYNQLRVMNKVAFRDLTGHGSEWDLEGEFINSLRFGTSLYQPFGPSFFALGQFEAESTNNVIANYQLPDTVFHTNRLIIGGNLGFHPFPGMELLTGLSYERYSDALGAAFAQKIVNSAQESSMELFTVTAAIDRRDSSIFPMDGFAWSAIYRMTDPGTENAFKVLGTEGEIGASLSTPFSVFLLGKFGTDFSQSASDTNYVPIFYRPTLADRRFFPGLVNSFSGTDSHIFALGLELKYQPDRFVTGFRFPTFFLIQFASGLALPAVSNLTTPGEYLYHNLAGGIGIRFADSFGLLLRIGETFTNFRSFFYGAVDIGSFATGDH